MALDRSILDDLAKGQATIKVIPQTNDVTDTMFDDADKFFTVKDSFTLEQTEPTLTEVKIDQYDETIDTTVETGEFNVSGSIPSMSEDLFDHFYEEATEQPALVSGITGEDGSTKYKKAKAYYHDPKEVRVTMFVESQSKKNALILTDVKLFAYMSHTSVQSNLFAINFSGKVMKPKAEGVGSFVVLHTA